LVHPSGNTAWLEIYLDEDKSYMTSGKMASILFGITEPTQVILTYHENNSTFTLINNANVTSIDEVEEELGETIFPFNDNTYTLHPYEDDQLFGWEQKISKAMACNTKNQVLVSFINKHC
jgi:hypothetical protein